MFDGLLPIGSVVLLKNGNKRLMIIGVCQYEMSSGDKKFWEYAGCCYPEGYLGADQTFLFNGDQIDKVFSIGFQDKEQFEFKQKADAVCEEYKQSE